MHAAAAVHTDAARIGPLTACRKMVWPMSEYLGTWHLLAASTRTRGQSPRRGAVIIFVSFYNLIKYKKVRRVTLTGDYTINNQMQVHVRVHTPSVARHLTDSSAAAGRASTLRTLHGGTPCSTEVSREPAVLSRQRCHHLSALSELIRRPEHDQDQSRGPVRSLRPVTLVAALYRG